MYKDDLIRDLRIDGRIMGAKPCYVILKKNPGNIYTGKTSKYIMTLANGTFLFFKLGFFDRFKGKDDFSLKLSEIKEYALVNSKQYSVLYLYFSEKTFVPLVYQNASMYNTTTAGSIKLLVEEFDKLGIKKIR